MLSHLYLMINEGYLAIPEKFEKLIISLRTAQAKEYSLDKEQTSYDDLLDALRLSLKGYYLEWIKLKIIVLSDLNQNLGQYLIDWCNKLGKWMLRLWFLC